MPTPPYGPQEVELIVNTPDVRVAEITLGPRARTPEHEHTEVLEICYCLEGELTSAAAGQPTVVLGPGQKMKFLAGVDHELRNDGDRLCRFLLIHGVGRFDFVASAKL